MSKSSSYLAVNEAPSGQLMKVALGEAKADLAIVNGSIVNVYTGEVLKGDTVLIKGNKIAYVGKDANQSIGATTEVIDASGQTLIPGLIDGHAHITGSIYSPSELIRYAIMGGTTTIITETNEIAFPLGYQGIIHLLKWVKNQPIKILATLPPMITISPIAKEHALTIDELSKLLRRKDVLGLGESCWAPVIKGDQRVLGLITKTIKSGKKVEGHTAGARGNKLQAYISLGISSCHEPITAAETLERLRLGMCVLIREGELRRDLAAIAQIKDENIDFRRLTLATDGLGAWQYTTDGYMDFVVQKAINLGFSPVLAIQMATINVAQHFALDDLIGGIAPGKYADIVIIPNLNTIQAEYVISNGQVVAKNGEPMVAPRKDAYPKSVQDSLHLNKDFKANDFTVPVASSRRQVKIRVIDQITELVTKEAISELPVLGGLVSLDTNQDIIKVAAIERSYLPGKTFVGFVRGFGLKSGAIATSTAWDCGDIIVVGASEADMALVVNRIRELRGGIVVGGGGKILAEIPLPIGGIISPLPMETIAQKLHHIQKAASDLGCTLDDVRITLGALSTAGIPFLRLCEQGLVNIRESRLVDLIVD